MWSSPLPGEPAAAPLPRPDGRHKPHLLSGSTNNLGAETAITYAPSTISTSPTSGRPAVDHPAAVSGARGRAGRDRTTTSAATASSRVPYHHGYFDGEEREFRGFGMVEQFDTEEFAVLNVVNSATNDNVDVSTHVPPVSPEPGSIRARTWNAVISPPCFPPACRRLKSAKRAAR